MSSRRPGAGALSAGISPADPGVSDRRVSLLGARRPEPHARPHRNRRERERLLRHRLDVLGGRARGLATILDETRRPAEAAAARHLAELADQTAQLVHVLPADDHPAASAGTSG